MIQQPRSCHTCAHCERMLIDYCRLQQMPCVTARAQAQRNDPTVLCDRSFSAWTPRQHLWPLAGVCVLVLALLAVLAQCSHSISQ